MWNRTCHIAWRPLLELLSLHPLIRVISLQFICRSGVRRWWNLSAPGLQISCKHKYIGTRTAVPVHDVVIKWKHFLCYWPFVRVIHRSPVNSPHKCQWRGALVFFFDLRMNKRLSKQSGGWWFETPSRPLWRHSNDDRQSDMSCYIR